MSEQRRQIAKWAVAVLIGMEALMLVPYKDEAGVWTDGVGNTKNVVPGKPITYEKAMSDLGNNLQEYEQTVSKALTNPATDGQFAAYTIFTFNIGSAGFRSSQTLKDHNAGRYMDACLRMLRWDKITVKGKKVVSKGLARRRYEEYNICIAGVPDYDYTSIPRRRP